MQLFRVKVPIIIEMVVGSDDSEDDGVMNKADAIDRIVSILHEDADIAADCVEETEESLVSFEKTDTRKVPL